MGHIYTALVCLVLGVVGMSIHLSITSLAITSSNFYVLRIRAQEMSLLLCRFQNHQIWNVGTMRIWIFEILWHSLTVFGLSGIFLFIHSF